MSHNGSEGVALSTQAFNLGSRSGRDRLCF